MKTNKIFGFEKNVFFAGLTSFLTDTSSKMVYSIMPLFLMSIGASKTTISMIEGIAESTSALLKAFSGFWSDKIGKNKPFMVVGYSITALITPMYSFVKLPVQALFLRFFERVGKGIRTAPRDNLIGASVNKKNAGKNFGFHEAMDNSGAILGPLIAFAVLYFFPKDYSKIFWLATIPAAMGIFTIISFIKEVRPSEKRDTKNISFRHLPSKYYFFLLIVFIFSLGNSTDALLLVKTAGTGVKQSYVPIIYMIFNVVTVLFAIPAGKLSDKIGREKLIIFGFFVYSIVYFLFGTFNNIFIFIGLFVLYGIYSALSDGAQKALISDIVHSDIKGTGFGIYNAILGIALLPASFIAGELYDKVNSGAPFYFGGTMALIAMILMIIFSTSRSSSKEREIRVIGW